MAQKYRTKSIVLGKEEKSESDRLFNVFSQDFGKIDVRAKAIRKINSKLKSGIDLFYLSEIEFIEGKNYKTLTDAILINNFSEIKKNPEKFSIISKVACIIGDFVRGQEYDNKIFNLLNETFNLLNRLQVGAPSGSCKLQVLYLYFVWKFFSILGYGPEIYQCVACKGELKENELFFSLKDGGCVCQKCAKVKEGSVKISADNIKILRLILKNKLDTILKLKINLGLQKELNTISKKYYLYLLQPRII